VSPVATVVSARLGGHDGVAVEARKWEWALGELGFVVRRVAGEIDDPRPGDEILPGFAIEPPAGESADPTALARALAGSDLVVVENLCSLPLNLDASRTAAGVLAAHRGRVVLRHHDLPRQRRHLAHLDREFPPRPADALHVTVNLRSMRDLASQGIPAVAMHNRFDFDAPPGDRTATRAARGFGDDELVVLQPTRAIERKNVPGGVRVVRALAELLPERPVRYWLTGPAEDGYGPTLDRVLARCPVPVTLGRAASAADAYAASDVVLFPSTWEGFGNPTVESIAARRLLVAFPYPVLTELAAYGLQFFSTDTPEDVVRFVRNPDESRFDLNLARARKVLSLADLPAQLEESFATVGWRAW
jgi:hypothetical protein